MAEIKNGRLIVVLGMHRSGTSAITRGLQVLGVELGDRLLPPVAGENPTGFWEDSDLFNLNKEMLHSIGRDWHDLAPIRSDAGTPVFASRYFVHAAELLRLKVGSSPIFGIKDPRLATLLPFWKEVFGHCRLNAGYVLAVRHPLSVVKSLAKRNGFDAEKSYLQWLGHVIASLSGTAGEKGVVVDYDCLMQSPDRELGRIAECHGLEISPVALVEYKAAFLDQGLRHTVYEPSILLADDACPPLVHEIYMALLDVASDKIRLDDPALRERIVRWAGEFDRLVPSLTLIDRLVARSAAARPPAVETDERLVSLNLSLAERDRQIATLNQFVAERNERIITLLQAVTERDARIIGFDHGLADREGRLITLYQAVTERDARIVSLNQAMVECDRRIAALAQDLADRQREYQSHVIALESAVEAERRTLSSAVAEAADLRAQLSAATAAPPGKRGAALRRLSAIAHCAWTASLRRAVATYRGLSFAKRRNKS